MDDAKQWNTCSCPFMRDAPVYRGDLCQHHPIAERALSLSLLLLKPPLNFAAGVRRGRGRAMSPCGLRDRGSNLLCVKSAQQCPWPRVGMVSACSGWHCRAQRRALGELCAKWWVTGQGAGGGKGDRGGAGHPAPSDITAISDHK